MSTPCEKLGYKIGDKFRVTYAEIGFQVGQTIELQQDDGTGHPLFIGANCIYENGVNGEVGGYFSLEHVKKVVDSSETSSVESPHQVETDLSNTSKQETTQENKTMTSTSLKINDQVIIKKGVTDFRYGGNRWMATAQRDAEVLTISSINDEGCIYAEGVNDGASFIEAELELVANAKTEFTDEEYEVKPKLVPFALDTDYVTAEQANEILSLAVKLGAKAYESAYDDEHRASFIGEKYPNLAIATHYDIDDFEWVGVDEEYDTLLTDNLEQYNDNKLTYSEAKLMLTGVKRDPSSIYKVKPKLASFYLHTEDATAAQINELFALAIGLGATPYEAVVDEEESRSDAKDKHPALHGVAFYDKSSFQYVGINSRLRTYVGSRNNFEDNKLTYEEAKVMLTGIKNEVTEETTKGDTKLTNQKPALKSFYFPIEGLKAEVINNIFKRLIAVGAVLKDTTYDSGAPGKTRAEFGEIPGTNCEVACFNLAGLSKRHGDFVTWVNDQPSQFDDEAVAMTLEEVLTYVHQLEGKSSNKPKVPTLRQRKVKIVYTNDKGYQLKNVISVDIKSEEGTVNITYKQRKGKVVHNNNVVIPFSELKSVKFVGPKVVGAEYIFKGGKVVQVIQDFTYEAFTHKSH